MKKHYIGAIGISVLSPISLQGAGSFYDPYSLLSGNKLIPATENFYYTDAISDTVAKFIREHKEKNLYWEHEGNRAIRKGDWKLVSEAWPVPQTLDSIEILPLKLWELYDLKNDRSELNNLAEKYPEKVQEMAAEWQNWALRAGAVPKPPQKLRLNNKVRNELLNKIGR